MSNTGENLSALMKDAAASGSDGNAEGGDGDGKSLESQNESLRQRVVAAERRAQESVPYVNLILKLRDAGEVGPKIIEKLINNEPLTGLEEKKVVEEVAKATPLTEERVLEILAENNKTVVDAFGQRITAQNQATAKNQELDTWAKEKLPGFEHMKGSRQWGDTLDVVLGLYHAKKMYIPEGKDHWEAVYERAYATCVAEDPDIVKGKQPAAQSEAERLKDILAGRGKKASSEVASEKKDDFKDAPEHLKRDLEFARSIGSGTIGKSFGRKAKMKS